MIKRPQSIRILLVLAAVGSGLAAGGCGSSGKGKTLDGDVPGADGAGLDVGWPGDGALDQGGGGLAGAGGGGGGGAGGSMGSCGGPGLPCCERNGCTSGGCCVNGVCMSPGATCVGLGNGICSNGTCGTCGGAGLPCCGSSPASGVCTASATVCSSNLCTACGMLGGACCANAVCDVGCCANGRCVADQAACVGPDGGVARDAPAAGTGGRPGSGGVSGAGGMVSTGGTTSAGGAGAGGRGSGGAGSGGVVATGGAGQGGSRTGGSGGVVANGGATGGARQTGGVPGTGGTTGGTGGTGGASTQPQPDAGPDAPIVDPCGDSCTVGTFCNDARAVCLPAGVEWVLVPGGTFVMGSDTAPSAYSESEFAPEHAVTVPSFELLRSEVTVTQYRACVDAGACTIPNYLTDSRTTYNRAGSDHHPVNQVSAVQAAAYCAFIGGRLPSEAEWEYAASNGGQGKYPWNYGGDASGFDCDHAVIGSNGCGKNSTWEVCSKPLGNTSHGLCDLTGNVAEWTADDFSWYDPDGDGTVDTPVDGSAYISPTHTDATSRVTKGGAYIHTVAWGTSVGVDMLARTYRQGRSGTEWSYIFGFRCARTPLPGGG